MQAGSLAGAALVLWAFAAVQFGRMAPTSPVYLGLNFAGSVLLATVAGFAGLWGFVVLNAVWAAVSARGLGRALGNGR